MDEYSPMQIAKRRMYAMRNGIVADALRKGGSPYRMIFGVNLPQLAEIAAELGQSLELADKLWADSSTRESMLIAPMLMPLEAVDREKALAMVDSAVSREAVDVLCLKLLRRLPFALQLADELMACDGNDRHYAGLRLMCNLAPQHPARAVEAGKAEAALGDKAERQLASILCSYEEML